MQATADRTRKTVYSLFESVEDLLRFARTIPADRVAGHEYFARPVRMARFVGRVFADWQETYQAARSHWPEGLKAVQQMLADLAGVDLPQPSSRRRRVRFGEDNGDEVDYDRLRGGQPFWRTSRRQSSRGPATITILVDVGANCGVDHRDILWRGAAAVALACRLEQAGYRVELWAVHRNENLWASGHSRFDWHQVLGVCLKRPGDPIDPSTLAAAVSGWFFRTLFFRLACSGDRPIAENLGTSRVPTPEDLDQISRDPQRILVANVFSYSAAVELIRNRIASLERN